MKTLREIAAYITVDNVDMTKEDKMAYAKEIKELIPTINGNEELAKIAKNNMANAAKILEDDSKKLDEFSYMVLADIIREVAVFIENPKPRLIKAQSGYYYDKVEKDKIYEFFGGRNYKLVRLASGKIAIYKLKYPERNRSDK